MRRFLLIVALTAPAAAFAQLPDMKPGLDAYDKKDYAACAKFFTQYAREKNNTDARYYSGMCYALAGEKDAAFQMLDDALAHGFGNPPQLEKDPDLASLRSDPRWPSVMDRANKNLDNWIGDSNRELIRIEMDDQADRSAAPIDWSALGKRDLERRTRVRKIIAAGAARTAYDFRSAALVMQHGDGADDYRMAHELAMRAVALDPNDKGGRWLAAATEDRYLHCIGKPQIWGTQFRRNTGGPWTMDPIDETAVTDEERAKWNVPPLAEAKRRLADANLH
jgi:tetratricopeptide (TPR) repeat protein